MRVPRKFQGPRQFSGTSTTKVIVDFTYPPRDCHKQLVVDDGVLLRFVFERVFPLTQFQLRSCHRELRGFF